MFARSGDVFIYLSTPFSLCLCFLDISKPPPHAPCTGHNMVITLNILILSRLLICTALCSFFPWRSIFSYIHMKPHIVLFTDVGNFIDGIKGSVDGGTSGGSHKQWNIPLRCKGTAHKKEKDNSWLNSGCYVLFFLPDCWHQRDRLKHVAQMTLSFHLHLLLGQNCFPISSSLRITLPLKERDT